jgi:hypothetical protein
MPPATITIDNSRLPKFPRVSMTRSGIKATDKLICDWSDGVTLSKQLLGFKQGNTYFTPQLYDAGDDPLENVYCTDVVIEPHEGKTNGEHVKALLTVTYSTIDYDPETATESGTGAGSVTYVTESLEPAAQFITLPVDKLFWAKNKGGGTVKEAEAPAQIFYASDWVYTLHHMPTVPNWVWTKVGQINNASVYSWALDKTFNAEELLIGNPSLSREITSEGITDWTLTVRLKYNPETWNKFPRTSSGNGLTFDNMYNENATTDAGYEKFYTLTSFSDVIIL